MKEIVFFLSGCKESSEKVCLVIGIGILATIMPISLLQYSWIASVLSIGYEVCAFWFLLKVIYNVAKRDCLDKLDEIQAKLAEELKQEEEAA